MAAKKTGKTAEMGAEPREPKTYAIAHAFKTTSYVAVLDNQGQPPEIVRLRTDAQKQRFLHLDIRPGDKLYMDLGGPGDRVALIAKLRGAEVLRIPAFRLAADQPVPEEGNDGDKEPNEKKMSEKERGVNMRIRAYVEAHGWEIQEERASKRKTESQKGETGYKLTARKARAMAIAVAAANEPDLFLPMRKEDDVILEIQHAYRRFRAMQTTIIRAYQRMAAQFNDDYVLEIARDPQVLEEAGILDGKNVHAKSVLRAIRAMLVTFPEDERRAFEAKLGLHKLEARRVISERQLQGLFRKILDELMESDVISPVVGDMKMRKAQIERMLKHHQVYKAVFEPVPGCGPLIAARIMGAVVDIRRFRSRPDITAFAGYHHFEDGSRARRRTGHVSNWNQEFKQAVWQFTQQVVKMPGSPWRAKLDQRRAYELYKILMARQAQADAEGLDYEILPRAYRDKTVDNAYSLTPEDIAALCAHVDVLRKHAGVTTDVPNEEDGEEPPDEDEEDAGAEPAVRDKNLAKLVRGVKKSSLDKAYRWLGQQFIKHVYKEWTAFESTQPSPQGKTAA
jgi:hypothetical protein